MKAVLTDDQFSDPDWIFERKLDGIRCIATRDGASLRMLSRNDLPMNDRYPGIAAALAGQSRKRFTVDGEIVAVEGAALPETTVRAYTTCSTCSRWTVRTSVVAAAGAQGAAARGAGWDDPLRLPYRNEAGEAMFAEACANGWEGVIAKRADSVYTSKRSKDWLKFKCAQGQELVIGGFTAPRGSRIEFGALLVGVYDDGGLHYAGKVGTGFNRATLQALGGAVAAARARRHAVLRRPAVPRRHLGRTQAGRPVRLRRMDARRPVAPPALPRPARRQGPRRRGPGSVNRPRRSQCELVHQALNAEARTGRASAIRRSGVCSGA